LSQLPPEKPTTHAQVPVESHSPRPWQVCPDMQKEQAGYWKKFGAHWSQRGPQNP
jgi:hypothetical protein